MPELTLPPVPEPTVAPAPADDVSAAPGLLPSAGAMPVAVTLPPARVLAGAPLTPEDHVVQPGEAELLYHWLPKETGRLIMLEKTGHSFGARHPFTSTTKELEIVVEVCRNFFR